MKFRFLLFILPFLSLNTFAISVEDYQIQIAGVSCRHQYVTNEFRHNLREEFKTKTSLKINEANLLTTEELLEDATFIAQIQTALVIGPVVGVAAHTTLLFLSYPSIFSLSYFTSSAAMASTSFKAGIIFFAGMGMLPTGMLSDNFILKDDEDKEEYAQAKLYLAQSLVLEDIKNKLLENERTRPEIILDEEQFLQKQLENRVYWKKALRYEKVVENLTSRQELLKVKESILSNQKELLIKLCN